MARRRSLPPVSPKVAAELRPLVAAIAEVLEVGGGVRGNPLDAWVTKKDLIDSGIGKLGRGGAGGGLVPGDGPPGGGTPNLSIPPKPTGFNAVGGFNGAINLTWDLPKIQYSNHAYTNIYRATEDNFANATKIGKEDGGFYTDYLRDDVTPVPYYYWISFTSTSDVEGPLNDTAGTVGQALFDPDYIISLLQGMLTESELAAELLTPIQSIQTIQQTLDNHGIRIPTLESTVAGHAIEIPSMQGLLNDYGPRITAAEGTLVAHSNAFTAVNASIASAELDIIANADAYTSLDTRVIATENSISSQAGEITALQASLNDLTIAEFDAGTTYALGELFRYNNIVYEVAATQTPPNVTPPNATYYTPRPDYETIADTVSANSAAVSALDTRVTSAEGSITAQATDITLLQSDMSTAQGGITANANATSALSTRVTDAEGAITSASGQITTLQNNLAAMGGNVNANAGAVSALETRVTDAEGELTTQSGKITVLENSATTQAEDIAANANATTALENRVTIAEGEVSTQSSDISSLQNSVGTVDGKTVANANALGLLTTRVEQTETGITTQSSRITQVENDIQNMDVSGNAAAISSLDSRVKQTETDITAQGQALQQVESEINGVSSAVQTKAEAQVVTDLQGEVVGIKARYSIKLDVNGRMSGLIFGDDGTQSSLVVASNSMFFVDPGRSVTQFNPATNYSSLEALRNTQFIFGYANVEGQSRFAINVPAYIPEGYITKGQIGAVGFGSIEADDGTPVTTVQGKLKAEFIDVDNLRVAVSATFDGNAQSGNFAPGMAGWKLWQSGSFEAYNVTVRGRIEADTGYIASTLQVGGTSNDIGDLLQMASNASSGLSIVDSWKRPGTTLINGDQIFTGAAYVDTLQIKGQAVTFPRGSYAAASQSVTQLQWATLRQLTVTLTGAPIIIIASSSVDSPPSTGAAGDTANLRVTRTDGSTVISPTLIATASVVSTNNEFLSEYRLAGAAAIVAHIQSPGTGSMTYYLQGKGGNHSNRSLVILEAKR